MHQLALCAIIFDRPHQLKARVRLGYTCEDHEFKSKNRSVSFQKRDMLRLALRMKIRTPLSSIARMKPAGKYASEEERWQAVVNRDTGGDGKFYYSVKTTGVYCRPSCGARLALRENVSFHDSPEAAECAGFRPCRRCQPDGLALSGKQAAIIAKACRNITENINENPILEVLAKEAGMSKFHFHRLFTKITGLTPKAYAKAHRAERVRQELTKRNTITEAIYEAGFNSNGRFYAESSRILGMRPMHFRQGGGGEAIRYVVGTCSLGAILVAASNKGICAISLGDDPDELIKNLKNNFPKAELIGGDKQFERMVARVVAFVETPQIGLDLPLDVRGTAFQHRVWNALCKIPAGSISNYSAIAKTIGSPKASRAVARACAANVLAVAIPCHRVLRRDGSVSGYRWGVERKRVLLKKEQAKLS